MAELLLAQGDAAAALARLPADDSPGMNGEMRTRGLALRVAAEARSGALHADTVQACRVTLAAASDHAVATLELRAALAAAARAGATGVPESAADQHAGYVERLAASLDEHPTQRAAFRKCWA